MIAAAEAHLNAFFAAWGRHDPDELSGFYAVDAMMLDPTLSEPRVGRDSIRRYYAEMFGTLDQPTHDLLDFAARNGRIWFEWSFERFRGVSVQTLQDGLIVHDHAFWNPDA